MGNLPFLFCMVSWEGRERERERGMQTQEMSPNVRVRGGGRGEKREGVTVHPRGGGREVGLDESSTEIILFFSSRKVGASLALSFKRRRKMVAG